MMPSPRVSASREVSTIVTGMPALAKHIAMPPPMVPAPITVARAMSRGLVPAGMPGTLAASRSAKKICLCAFDWSPSLSLENSSRSRLNASSIGISIVARTASITAAGAASPRVRLADLATASSNAAGLSRNGLILSSRSRVRRSAIRSATARCANAIAACVTSPCAISSTRPYLSASAAGIGSPLRIIGRALSMPIRRGSRCVPPAPGRRPSLISGRPSRVPGAATR